jgi:hypothetical protein
MRMEEQKWQLSGEGLPRERCGSGASLEQGTAHGRAACLAEEWETEWRHISNERRGIEWKGCGVEKIGMGECYWYCGHDSLGGDSPGDACVSCQNHWQDNPLLLLTHLEFERVWCTDGELHLTSGQENTTISSQIKILSKWIFMAQVWGFQSSRIIVATLVECRFQLN